jgi:hypothetical protein
MDNMIGTALIPNYIYYNPHSGQCVSESLYESGPAEISRRFLRVKVVFTVIKNNIGGIVRVAVSAKWPEEFIDPDDENGEFLDEMHFAKVLPHIKDLMM